VSRWGQHGLVEDHTHRRVTTRSAVWTRRRTPRPDRLSTARKHLLARPRPGRQGTVARAQSRGWRQPRGNGWRAPVRAGSTRRHQRRHARLDRDSDPPNRLGRALIRGIRGIPAARPHERLRANPASSNEDVQQSSQSRTTEHHPARRGHSTWRRPSPKVSGIASSAGLTEGRRLGVSSHRWHVCSQVHNAEVVANNPTIVVSERHTPTRRGRPPPRNPRSEARRIYAPATAPPARSSRELPTARRRVGHPPRSRLAASRGSPPARHTHCPRPI
jgi:hypothetical protein